MYFTIHKNIPHRYYCMIVGVLIKIISAYAYVFLIHFIFITITRIRKLRGGVAAHIYDLALNGLLLRPLCISLKACEGACALAISVIREPGATREFFRPLIS